MYTSFGDNRVYYRVCKQLNILPLSVRFDYKDMIFFHSVFYNLNHNICPLPPYLQRFTGSRLRRSHFDNLSIVSEIHPNTPQNVTSANTRCLGISKSFFYRAHLIWNRLPYDLRSIEAPSLFRIGLLKFLWGEVTNIITSDLEAIIWSVNILV